MASSGPGTTLPMESSAKDVVLEEINDDSERMGEYIGQCKWFQDRCGFGFITIVDKYPECNGADKGKDIFVHHTGIRPKNSQYKTLKKGEYVMFDVQKGEQGLQAVNVRGVFNGPLMCDMVQVRKQVTPYPSASNNQLPRASNGPSYSWKTVQYKKPRTTPVVADPVGTKRRRFGGIAENVEVPSEHDAHDDNESNMGVDYVAPNVSAVDAVDAVDAEVHDVVEKLVDDVVNNMALN